MLCMRSTFCSTSSYCGADVEEVKEADAAADDVADEVEEEE